MPTIAVIAAQSPSAEGAGTRALELVARTWPSPGAGVKLEHLSQEQALRALLAIGVRPEWDACVVRLDGSGVVDGATLRLLDTIQQALVPGIVLHRPGPNPLGAMQLDGLIPAPADSPPATIAAMLYSLCHRQATVRTLEQTIRLNQAAQGEAAAEIGRLHDELLLASRVQREFLPKSLPSTEEFEAAVIFRPAGFVSGDIYDISRLDEDHLGFFLADAMGHGVPAALMTLFISANIPQKEITGDTYRLVPPAEAMERLNRDLCASRAGPTRFATAVCGIIDIRTGDVSVACAGHPPPLRIGPGGMIVTRASGTLLGVVEGVKYEQDTFRLDEGEVLLVHSDGVELALPGSKTASLKELAAGPAYLRRLAAIRDEVHRQPIGTALEMLADDIDNQSGSLHQHDDVTILAFERAAKKQARRTA